MRFSLNKNGRNKSTHSIVAGRDSSASSPRATSPKRSTPRPFAAPLSSDLATADPLSRSDRSPILAIPSAEAVPAQQSSLRSFSLQRSVTVLDRSKKHEGAHDRRSITVLSERLEHAQGVPPAFSIESPDQLGSNGGASLVGSAQVLQGTSASASCDSVRQPPTRSATISVRPSMNNNSGFDNKTFPGKTSSDSGQNSALDRWSQRRLQRLNTEQGFREQRQGSHGTLLSSATPVSEHQFPASFNSNHVVSQHPHPETLPPSGAHQPHTTAYQTQRTGQATQSSSGYGLHTPQPSKSSTSTAAQSQDPSAYSVQQQQQQQHLQHSPDSITAHSESSYQNPSGRPSLQQPRLPSSHQQAPPSSYSNPDESPKSTPHNANPSATKTTRVNTPSNRQSVVQNGSATRDGTGSVQAHSGGQPGMPAFNTAVVPQGAQSSTYANANTNGGGNGTTHNSKGAQGQAQQQQQGDVGRVTPLPTSTGDDMTEEDIAQLIKDHKELREKYTKVKKYYFEKEDQVKQLQNSLAHQRLSQSRTSLDDSEYTTRFSRLDGLVAQLAFSIRKSWKSIPPWLHHSVNKDAVITGKQEMIVVGRAFISCWIVEECFKSYFHPDLEPTLSAELKAIQTNIRLLAPPPHNAEEEEALTSKVVNWRLATLDGLQDKLRSPQCAAYRSKLMETLKQGLIRAIAAHLHDPPPPDLEGGVNMIIELVVSIAVHLPLESRDVAIEYYMPGSSIMQDQMKVESGIPALHLSIADDQTERTSEGSMTSDATDLTENTDIPKKKRSMLSALTGTGKVKPTTASSNKHSVAGGSSTSLSRPESTHSDKEPRVRMAGGIGVQIRGRGVLVKAPVYSTL